MRCEFGLLGVESVFNLGNICTCHAFILFLDSVLRTVSDPLYPLIVDFPQFDTFQDFVPYRRPMNADGMPRSARGYKSGHFGSDRRRYLMMVKIGGPNKRQATSINSVSEFNHSKRRHLYPLCKYLS